MITHYNLNTHNNTRTLSTTGNAQDHDGMGRQSAGAPIGRTRKPPQQIAQPKKYEGNQLLLPQILSFLFHPCFAVLTNLCFSQT